MTRLYIDIGNTMLKCGVDDGDTVKLLFRILSNDINDKFLSTLFSFVKKDEIIDVTIASVVPSKTNEVISLLKDIKVRTISPLDKSNFSLKIDNPGELGADLFCDLVGAKEKYGNDLIVIDLGTASKFLYLDDKGVFNSCAITPGIAMSLKVISKDTALLPDIALSNPKKLLDCHNTIDVLSSSAYYSYIAMVNGIIKQYEEEIGHKVKIILTGGYINLFKNKFDFDYVLDENLGLYGIKTLTSL